MKYLLGPVLSLILFAGLASFSFAQDYQLLQPLPIGAGGTEARTITPTQYISGMFMLIIGIAGVLAVIMIIVGGVKYMTTDAMGAKSDAKKTIQNAIFGLLLALGAWIILYSIGGDRLTNFNISLGAIPAAGTPPPGQQDPQAWNDDSAIRSSLASYGISVNRPNCQTIGQTACTSVWGLSGSIQFLLRDLERLCTNCNITITGGTEYWLHSANTQHRPGGNVVDLRNEPALRVFLQNNPGSRPATGTSCAPGRERYVWGGATFVFEEPSRDHWHVCI